MDQQKLEKVLKQIGEKVDTTTRKQSQMSCRTFLNKLGFKARSQQLIEQVEATLQSLQLQFDFQYGETSWKEIPTSGKLVFKRLAHQTKNVKPTVVLQNSGSLSSSTKKVIIQETIARPLYAYQQDAIQQMNQLYRNKENFRSLLVLPTGGGKTVTAAYWVLQQAINKHKKVLWLAHRYELLDQAAVTFEQLSVSSIVPSRMTYQYKIVSGQHERKQAVTNEDDLVFASKDSLQIRLDPFIEQWLQNSQDIVIVIDEAHHATAKSYRTIVEAFAKKHRVTLLGLTATPFRTAEQEQGLLKQVFYDNIVYKKDLKSLISAGILAAPTFLDLQTKIDIACSNEDVQKLLLTDQLGEQLATNLASHRLRNELIVMEYVKKRHQYKQTIVFAVNQLHALMLEKMFQKQKIRAQAIVSGDGLKATKLKNAQAIQQFRTKKLDVLINVNMLTEGADFPAVQTVFLTRPTISTILMTQMIGRALRGVQAGGTETANIVSFIDDWTQKIAWVNPRNLVNDIATFEEESRLVQQAQITKLISQKMLTQLALFAEANLEESQLMHLQFQQSVPVGLYAFSYLKETASGSFERQCEVLVFAGELALYEQAFKQIQHTIKMLNVHTTITIVQIKFVFEKLNDQIQQFKRNPYFTNDDLENLIYFYVQKGSFPTFLKFAQRKQIDLRQMAQTIIAKNYNHHDKAQYLQTIWQAQSFLRLFFSQNEIYFRKCIDTQLLQLDVLATYEQTSLMQLKQRNETYLRYLVDAVYEAHKEQDYYYCVKTGFKSKMKKEFQIMYKKSLRNGGTTTLTNLQLVRKQWLLEQIEKRKK